MGSSDGVWQQSDRNVLSQEGGDTSAALARAIYLVQQPQVNRRLWVEIALVRLVKTFVETDGTLKRK